MTSKAQDFLLAQSSSDISVQLCTRWTAELSHSEYEQLWFIHSCQSWWVTGTVLTAHTSQKFPRAKSIPGRRKDRSIFPPLAPNKAQPWPEKRAAVAAPHLTGSWEALRVIHQHYGIISKSKTLLLIPALPSPLNFEQHPDVTPGHECWRSNLSYQRGKQGNNQVYWNCINKSMLSVQLSAHFFKTSYPKTCKGVSAVELKKIWISVVDDMIWLRCSGVLDAVAEILSATP